jgi:hypothetical protein
MPDTTFETVLTRQLRAYADGGVRPVDRFEIAEQTIATGRGLTRWRRASGWAPASGRRVLIPLLVGLLLAALVGGAILIGGRLFARPHLTAAPDLPAPMEFPTLVPLGDGRVLMIGTVATGTDRTPRGYLYDLATGVSAPVESLTGVPLGPAVRLHDGRVLIIGDRSARVFDPTTLRLDPAGPMMESRSWPAVAVLHDGRVLIAGDDGGGPLTAELFDPDTSSFFPVGSPKNVPAGQPSVIREATATLSDGRVFVLVSVPTSTGWYDEAEIYNPATRRFSAAGTAPDDFGVAAAVATSNGGVVIFGSSSSVNPARRVGRAVVWDPTANGFSPAADPPAPVRTATLLSDGRIFLTGATDLIPTSSWAGTYDPTTGLTTAAETPAAWRPGVVGLADGRVLLAGGLRDGGSYVGPDGTLDQAPAVPTVEIFQ